MKTRVVKSICIIATFLILITLRLDIDWTDPRGFRNTGEGGGGREGGKKVEVSKAHDFFHFNSEKTRAQSKDFDPGVIYTESYLKVSSILKSWMWTRNIPK